MTDDQITQIRERAEGGDYRCRDHFGQFDADADVLGLLALVDQLRLERDYLQEAHGVALDQTQILQKAVVQGAREQRRLEKAVSDAQAASLRLRTALEGLSKEWRRQAALTRAEIQPGGIREHYQEGPRYGIAAVESCADELEAALVLPDDGGGRQP